MKRKSRFTIGNKSITFAALALVIFGSLMIASAEMGNSVGDTSYLTDIIIRQVAYALIGVLAYFACINMKFYRLRKQFFYAGYVLLFFALIACRFFGQINGAYAWIRLPGGATIQPSEFAKAFMIIFGAKMVGKDKGKDNMHNFINYAVMAGIYFVTIVFIQRDLGSAVVLFVICYFILMIPPYKEYKIIQRWMTILIFVGIGVVALLLSPPVTKWMMKHSDNYMFGRFLAAANPFLYRYDNGYHVIMSLVSFASGNIFGLGYGNSIHKYMNFPNPSNDFILPVIVEELGIIGFAFFVIAYIALLAPLIVGSIKAKYISSKMVMLGAFTYFIVHFILNVGGVTALIPLTGVPLLLVSSGGSSLMASMAALGLAQAELIRNKSNDEDNNNEV